jgi:hypothetical protein
VPLFHLPRILTDRLRRVRMQDASLSGKTEKKREEHSRSPIVGAHPLQTAQRWGPLKYSGSLREMDCAVFAVEGKRAKTQGAYAKQSVEIGGVASGYPVGFCARELFASKDDFGGGQFLNG